MEWKFYELLNLFHNIDQKKLLLQGVWGIERESQRVTPSGDLALTRHPSAFGDKLHNANITTDFSESQLELITEPYGSLEEMYGALKQLHIQVEKILENELLWPLSMPPKLPDEKEIPIAKFDDSTEGRTREIYRRGLAWRYGKKMQMICGLHYNYSFGKSMLDYLFQQLGDGQSRNDFTNEVYFSVARNFLKYRWLLIYLFGASPSFDSSYDTVIDQKLENSAQKYTGLEDAVSLRVSPFGYGNSIKKGYSITYNNLSEYIRSVKKLLTTKSSRFAKLGIYKDHQQIQLNDYMLQSEAELYSFVRFKQNLHKGETQIAALEERGIKYLEIRILDINPFEKTGITMEQLYFMQVFMMYCLFESNEPITDEILEKTDHNHDVVALFGRKSNVNLYNYKGTEVTLQDWAQGIFEKLKIIATYMDQGINDTRYEAVIKGAYEKILDPSKLLSARIMNEMKENKESYLQFGIRRALFNQKIQ